MYFHVYLIYRFTRTFTDHSSIITRCWGFELQNGKSSLKSPQTLATQDFAPASFLSTPDKKALKSQGFMFIGTQCDLWGRPNGTGHEKISRGNFPRLIFSLIPSLSERQHFIGYADLIHDSRRICYPAKAGTKVVQPVPPRSAASFSSERVNK